MIVNIGKIFRCFALIGVISALSSCNNDNEDYSQEGKYTKQKNHSLETSQEYEFVNEGSQVKGEFWTNYPRGATRKLGNIYDEVVRIPVKLPIYDISFIVYSQEFAERHGYPNSHVTEMPDNLDMMAFKMKTGQGCIFQFLIDKGQGHFIEDKDSYHAFFKLGNIYDLGSPVLTPDKVDGFVEQKEDYELRVAHRHYRKPEGEIYMTTQTIFLAGQAYTPNKTKRGSRLSVFLEDYHAYVYRDLDYFSVRVGCTELPRKILEEKNAMFWVKKMGAPDFGKGHEVKAEYFIKIPIPDVLKRKAIKYMSTYNNYTLDVRRAWRKIALEQKNIEKK